MKRRGLICVAVAAANSAEVLAAVEPVLDLVDLVEIRLDALVDPAIEPGIAALGKPVLVTNRPAWEGGAFIGNEETRIDLLCRGLAAGARYVDIELRAEESARARILAQARRCGAQVIVSSHDFTGTPPMEQLRATLAAMMASGADIGKIVTTAADPGEALRILALQETALAAGFPLCAFAMGRPGQITRLATLYLGGFMTYASLAQGLGTAPGQIAVHDLHRLRTILEPAP